MDASPLNEIHKKLPTFRPIIVRKPYVALPQAAFESLTDMSDRRM